MNAKNTGMQNTNFNFSSFDSERINAVYQYTMLHFKHKLSLNEIAAVVYLSPNAFCRFFKSRVKKSFSQFLIDIRIAHACKLLIETEMPVSLIRSECGYDTFSNFNKHFKSITKKTPLQYRKYNQKAA